MRVFWGIFSAVLLSGGFFALHDLRYKKLVPAESDGSGRITYPNRKLNLIKDDLLTSKATSVNGIFDRFSNFLIQPVEAVSSGSGDSSITLNLVAEVSAPVLDSYTLQASDVVFDDHYVYVTYNLQGNTLKGGVEVFDVNKSAKPKLIGAKYYSDSKVNSAAISDDHRLFLVGNTTNEIKGPAYLRVLDLHGGKPDAELALIKLPSYAANSVFIANGRIYVTSGDKGGAVTVLDVKTYEILQTGAIEDPRWVTAPQNSADVYVFAGKPGRLISYNQSLIANTSSAILKPQYTLSLGGANVSEAKSSIQMGTNFGIASLGSNGFQLFCIKTGMIESTQLPPTIKGIDPTKNVTNNTTVTAGLIFSANGEGGTHAYSALDTKVHGSSGCNKIEIADQGRIDFGSAVSSNDVHSSDDVLYVASGIGGFKIIEIDAKLSGNPLTDFDQDKNGNSNDNKKESDKKNTSIIDSGNGNWASAKDGVTQ